jgi:hypothetical protein
MFKGVLLGALVALPLAGFAAVDTNVTYKSSIALGATYKDGNTEKSLFTMDLKGDRYSPKNDWINSQYGEYGKTEGSQTEGKLRGQSDLKHKFGGKNFYGGAFGEALTDSIKQIRFRGKLGPNVGYYWINQETHKFDTSVGVNYVYERTAAVERDYGEWRVAANYLVDLSETSDFYLNVEYSANLENEQDGNGLLVTGVKSQLKDNLSIFLELRDEYDNIPDTPTTEYNDVTILAGLAYDFM